MGGQARRHFNKAKDLLSVLTPFILPELSGPSVEPSERLPGSCCAYNQMCRIQNRESKSKTQ